MEFFENGGASQKIGNFAEKRARRALFYAKFYDFLASVRVRMGFDGLEGLDWLIDWMFDCLIV